MFKSNQGISTPIGILIIVICALLVGGILVWWKLPKVEFAAPEIEITKEIVPEDETANWKTYRNEEFGFEFEFKYPNNFFIKVNPHGERGLIILSNNKKFEDQETALIISLNIVRFSGSEDTTSPKARTDLNIEQFEKRLQTKIVTRFVGDPPWGYYNVAIPLPNSSEFVNFNTRLHQSDDPAYGGQRTDLRIFNQILSTFQFLE